MKIQIRQGVFETNSSSVHTLSISKSKTNFSKIKDSITKITFGPKKEYCWDADSAQDKINQIFCYVTCDDSLKHFISCKNKIERCLKSVGISCEFEFDENYDYYWYCDSRDVFDELFAEGDETFTILLLNYIYDKSSYTYCFDDNYFDETEFRNTHKDFKNYCAHD